MSTPNAARIGAHLEDVLPGLRDMAERLRVPFDSWPLQPWGEGWIDLALLRRTHELLKPGAARRATSPTDALKKACGEFGLSYNAVRKRWGSVTRPRTIGAKVAPTRARRRGRVQP